MGRSKPLEILGKGIYLVLIRTTKWSNFPVFLRIMPMQSHEFGHVYNLRAYSSLESPEVMGTQLYHTNRFVVDLDNVWLEWSQWARLLQVHHFSFTTILMRHKVVPLLLPSQFSGIRGQVSFWPIWPLLCFKFPWATSIGTEVCQLLELLEEAVHISVLCVLK